MSELNLTYTYRGGQQLEFNKAQTKGSFEYCQKKTWTISPLLHPHRFYLLPRELIRMMDRSRIPATTHHT